MPDPRIEEGSSSSQQQTGQQYDLPSSLDYKDQGRDYLDVVVDVVPATTTAESAAAAAPTRRTSRDLPSSIEYKDLGRNVASVMEISEAIIPPLEEGIAVAATGQHYYVQQELPSSVEYKDLGRDLESVMPSAVPYRNSGQYGSVQPVAPSAQQQQLNSPSPPRPPHANTTPGGPSMQSEVNKQQPPKRTPSPTNSSRRKYFFYGGAAVVVVLLAIIVGVSVALVGKDDNASEIDESSTPSPTISPSGPSTDAPTDTLAPTGAPPVWKSVTGPILGETVSENLGWAVDFSADGRILAAGAHWYNVNNNVTRAGQVRVYRRTGDSWEIIGRFNGSEAYDYYGFALALSQTGTTLAVGSPYPNAPLDQRAGAVHVYRRSDADVWTQMGGTVGVPVNYSDLGFAVDLNEDGTVCAVTYNGDDTVKNNTGSFEVYQFDSLLQEWRQIGDRIFGDEVNDFFGYAVRLNYAGNIVASGMGTISKPSFAKVYRYNATEENWDQLGQTIRATTETDNVDANFFGGAIALSKDGFTLAVGAPHTARSGQTGFVEVFQFDEIANRWEPQGSVLRGKTAGELFGYAVDISADGSIVVIGVPQYDNGPKFRAGRVEFYEFNGTHWNQFGETIQGEDANADLGFAVSLSEDGMTGVAGAYRDSTAGLASGKLVIVERNM